MKAPVGIGLVSFAHAHQNHWARAIEGDERAFVSGVWDGDAARGRAKAEALGVPWFPSLEDLLSHEHTYATTVCSANADKLELLRTVARAGRHTLVEKPPGADAADVPHMMEAVREAGITCVQSFPQRLIPANRAIGEMLAAGELGRIGMVRKRHGHGFALQNLATDMPWIVDADRGGGGALLDEGVHEIDLLRHYFGEPESVVAETGTLQTGLAVEDNAIMLFRFPGGPIVELASGWAWRAGGPTTEIYGTEGTVLQFFSDCASKDAPDPGGAHLRVWRRGGSEWEELSRPFPFEQLHERMARHFVDVLVDGHEPAASLHDGWRAMVIAEGAYRAAATGQRVRFDG